MKRPFLAFALCMIAAGCERRERFAAPDSLAAKPSPVAPGRSAYLSVSDLSPAAGAPLVVAGTIAVDDELSLGSFRVRLAYDPAMLTFVEDVSAPGMMRVVNPQPGEIVVVGASSGSSADGKLFALRFRVKDPAGLGTLALRIDELNDAAFADQKSTVTRSSRLVRDSTLSTARAVPR